MWLQPQYDLFVLKFILGVDCITKGEVVDTLKDCLPNQKVGLDFVRSSLLMTVLYPLAEEGHSVWSNACVWHTGLPKTDIYSSDKIRSAVGGSKMTMQ